MRNGLSSMLSASCLSGSLVCRFGASVCLLICLGCGDNASKKKGVTPKTITVETEESEKPAANEKGRGAGSTSSTASAPSSASVGHLVGTIVVTGTIPKPVLLITKGDAKAKDADVCAIHNILDESLLVDEDKGNGLAGVYVYLRKSPPGAAISAPPKTPVDFDQKGCVFLTHTLIVRVGQPVRVLSGDSVPHNVRTNPIRNNNFNEIVKPNDRSGLELIYAKREDEPVAVKCDVHSWMRAYHLPLEHPFAAITNADGRFEIKNLPAGKHKFRIWHERSKFLERTYEVEIRPNETTKINLSFPIDKFPRS